MSAERPAAQVDDPAWPPPPPGWRHDAPDPPDAFPVPWRWWDGLVLVLWTIGAQIVAVTGFLLAGFEVDDLDTTDAGITVFALAQVLGVAGSLLWLRRRGALSWRLLGPVRPRWGHVVTGILVGAAGFWLVFLVLAIVSNAFGPVQAPEQPVLERATTGVLGAVLGVVVGALGAPVLEELVFRSVLFQALRARTGLFPAMGMSAMVFGLAHVFTGPDAYGFMAALAIFGFWLAGAFHRTGTLVVPVVAHATFNLTAIVMRILAGA